MTFEEAFRKVAKFYDIERVCNSDYLYEVEIGEQTIVLTEEQVIELAETNLAEAKAREIISNQMLADLLDEWELTTTNNSPEVYTVRGWLMDEFEKRNPEAFNAWMDGDAEDSTLRDYMTR